LFVAVFPPSDVLTHLSDRLPSGARLTPIDRWHITLHFLGESDQLEVERALATVPSHGPMELQLAGAGTFGRSVLWTGVRGDLAALATLQQAVVTALGAPPADFTPHLTVTYARTAAVHQALQGYHGPTWTVSEFALVRSHYADGGGYEVLATWPV
jgi:2'-5' RNA ligase